MRVDSEKEMGAVAGEDGLVGPTGLWSGQVGRADDLATVEEVTTLAPALAAPGKTAVPDPWHTDLWESNAQSILPSAQRMSKVISAAQCQAQ